MQTLERLKLLVLLTLLVCSELFFADFLDFHPTSIFFQTTSEIHSILSSNFIQTSLCFRYARKFILSDFEELSFLSKISEPSGILTQPYKGRAIRELLKDPTNSRLFEAMLEKTIALKIDRFRTSPHRHGSRQMGVVER